MQQPRPKGHPQAARWLLLVGILLVLGAGSGCTSVNAGSARRLSVQALGATRALSGELDRVRAELVTYAEGQALLAPLTQRPVLAPSELCSLQSVQQSLRLRLMALSKLALAYEHLHALSDSDGWATTAPVFDELFTELDPADFPSDPPLAMGCPAPPASATPTPSPPLPLTDPAAPAPTLPPRSLGLSQGKSLKLASERIRQLLERLRQVLVRERSVVESVQRQLAESQKRIATVLVQRYDVLSPAPLLAPQLEPLGLRWDDWAYVEQRARWPKEQREALQAALLALLERRVAYLAAQQATLYERQLSVLAALTRLHQRLEAGQPFGVRELAQLLGPVLRSANSAASSASAPLGGTTTPSPTPSP